jgi:glyoxylase-like metal-dependent hydrolase (beta-lactamase superfamily II)
MRTIWESEHMREVADGVVEIPLGFVNVHLVVIDEGVVLVDTGLPRRAGKIEQALSEARHRVGEIRAILLTHRHWDHIGSVAELQRRSAARVLAHTIDVPMIEGTEPNPPRPDEGHGPVRREAGTGDRPRVRHRRWADIRAELHGVAHSRAHGGSPVVPAGPLRRDLVRR